MSISINVQCYAARPIDPKSWLNEPKYSWFVKGFHYASTQTYAIPTLSEVSPEALYHTVTLIMRGAGIKEPKEVV